MQVFYSKVASTKKGNRIFLEGKKLGAIGFKPSLKYDIEYDQDNKTITLKLNKEGSKIVSSRTRYEERLSVIDICNNTLSAIFPEGTKIVARAKDKKIIITEQEVQKNQTERETSLLSKLESGQTILEGSLCTGGGISTHAIHSALKTLGINSKVKMIAELDSRYIQVAQKNFPEIDVVHQCKIEEVEFQDIPKLDLLSFSLPCTGHSIAGKTSRGLKSAEEHPEAATSVFGALRYIVKSNPAILISENVPQAQTSATYILLKSELVRLGYSIQEFNLDEKQAGTIEKRRRYWFVATSKGLNTEDIVPTSFSKKYSSVGQIVDHNEDTWFAIDYFDRRDKENKEEGRGFKKNLITDLDVATGVIPRNYTKRQISNPHYTNGKAIRLFNLKEHSKLKGIPENLTLGLPATVGHEILGQSILYNHAFGLIKATFLKILDSMQLKVVS
jgi:DNA (cytosine-5)-methyltransferase 1